MKVSELFAQYWASTGENWEHEGITMQQAWEIWEAAIRIKTANDYDRLEKGSN